MKKQLMYTILIIMVGMLLVGFETKTGDEQPTGAKGLAMTPPIRAGIRDINSENMGQAITMGGTRRGARAIRGGEINGNLKDLQTALETLKNAINKFNMSFNQFYQKASDKLARLSEDSNAHETLANIDEDFLNWWSKNNKDLMNIKKEFKKLLHNLWKQHVQALCPSTGTIADVGVIVEGQQSTRTPAMSENINQE